MIGISKLYCNTIEPSDPLRYERQSKKLPSHLLQFSIDKKPVVVWNITQRCNLKCIHCYSDSQNNIANYELSTYEAKNLIHELSDYGIPVLLLSGGEPLMRHDIFEIIKYATKNNIRTVLSTNGTLITNSVAKHLKEIKLAYAGISIDGTEKINDRIRGIKNAFNKAIQGIRNCQKYGIKTGLRFTITQQNFDQLPAIFDLLVRENIPRVCFYHLVYTGRGSTLINQDISLKQKRQTINTIIDHTKRLFDKGYKKEVLTVDNHADGVYLYLRLLKENPEHARKVYELLKMNGGNNSGIAIACINWDGSVYPDQFWRTQKLGNIREKNFSEIWEDSNNLFLTRLRNRQLYIKGRCKRCKYFEICKGNFRARAEAVTGDIWEADPACYLYDHEISD